MIANDGFDWVDALSSCALSSVFEKLKLQIGDDVKRRRAQLLAGGATHSFQLVPSGTSFIVDTLGNKISGRAVKFRLTKNSIAVDGVDDKLMFEATLTLNDDGECDFLSINARKPFGSFA